eukprot:GEMP01086234.1.p1 GENE.GEMP01086234.1~~GEMP01086234.1.p1  ORF type:complete len:134 (+),score=1.07 GEMP01086234.1:109-510(+)
MQFHKSAIRALFIYTEQDKMDAKQKIVLYIHPAHIYRVYANFVLPINIFFCFTMKTKFCLGICGSVSEERYTNGKETNVRGVAYVRSILMQYWFVLFLGIYMVLRAIPGNKKKKKQACSAPPCLREKKLHQNK